MLALSLSHGKNKGGRMAAVKESDFLIGKTVGKAVNYCMMALILFSIIGCRYTYAAEAFNVDIELPKTYEDVLPGTQVWFTMQLLNLANAQRVDVTLDYELLDPENRQVSHGAKTVAIETQASFVADLAVPADATPGDYVLKVRVLSNLGDSEARTVVRVHSQNDYMIPYYYIGGIVLLLIIIITIFVKSRPWIRTMQLKMRIRRIVREKLKK